MTTDRERLAAAARRLFGPPRGGLDGYDDYEPEMVEIGGDLSVNRWAIADIDEGPILLRVVAESRPDGPAIVDLRIRCRPEAMISGANRRPAAVTSALLRRLSVTDLLDRAADNLLISEGRPGGPKFGPATDGRRRLRRAQKDAEAAGRRWQLSDALLAEVADTYRKAYQKRARPTAAVAARWGINRGVASRWVRRARETGHLGPAPRIGRAGEQPPPPSDQV